MSDQVKERGFTEAERDEIISRIQALENTCHGIANTVDGIAAFCERLAATLDAIGGNPLFAAMLPPEMMAQAGDGS
jgi:hypothetical protein